ncbi:MAG: hypothetical protein ACYTBJ_25480, partial [Planctomycetota bacterium]|jgi:hypothetical protein
LKPLIDLDELEGMARHKVRRIVRGGFLPVIVKPHTSLDLVEFSGMSVEALKGNVELHRHIRNGVLQVMETTLVIEVPDEEIEILEDEIEEVKEEPKKEEPEKALPKFPSVPKDDKPKKKKKKMKFFKKGSKEE